LKILVLRGGALGDLLLTFPVLDAIRRGFPQSFVEFWGIYPQAGLLQSVDRVARLDSLEVLPLFISDPIPIGLSRRLREFDLAVSFLSDPEGVVAEHLVSAGVQKVVNRSPMMQPGVHAVHQLATVLEPLGLELRDPVPSLAIDRNENPKSLLGFHPGSGSAAKNWPVESWIGFAVKGARQFENLLVIGGEADDAVIRSFQRRCRLPVIQTMLHPNLWDLARALSKCSFFVGHDTGVTHLAAAVKTPTVALFGPTDPAVWRPLGDHVKIVQSRDAMMRSIGLSEVLAAIGLLEC
jgi:heptosyltransferase-3